MQVVDDLDKEVGVLEVKQQSEVDENAKDQNGFLFSGGFGGIDPVRQIKIYYSGEQDEAKIKTASFVKEVK